MSKASKSEQQLFPLLRMKYLIVEEPHKLPAFTTKPNSKTLWRSGTKGPLEDPVKPAVYFTSDINVVCDPRTAALGKLQAIFTWFPPISLLFCIKK